MKTVSFKKITIKNFFSVGGDPVEVDFSPGFHVITGNNKDKIGRKNGAGKSTIIDAFYFAIFGRTIRDISRKEHIVNNITNNTCVVKLEFDVSSPSDNATYIIERRLKPSKLHFTRNGADITRDSIANTTLKICDVIGATPDIFKNCVTLTANNTVPFMGQGSTQKRKFIEGIFDLGAFAEMSKEARNDYNNIKRENDINITKMEEKEAASINYNNQKISILGARKDKLKKYRERQRNNKKELTALKNQLKKIKSVSLDDTNKKIQEIRDGIERVEKNIHKNNKTLAELNASWKHDLDNYNNIGTDSDVCPTCFRSITDHDRDEIEKEKLDLSKKIDNKKNEAKEVSEKISNLHDLLSKLKELREKSYRKQNSIKIEKESENNIKYRISQLNEWLDSLTEDINQLKNTNTDVDDIIKETQNDIKQLNRDIDKSNTALNIIQIAKFVVSEEGVKSYIVRQILQLFNSRLAFYLKKMDANCICVFNEYFEEEIINESNKICSYYNFSDGERKNIDLACLFTFADARRMQGNVSYNVSFFDELYDSSLDSKGIELVNNILNERVKKNNECIFVVTHRPDAIKAIAENANVIFLQKENGITTQVDYAG